MEALRLFDREGEWVNIGFAPMDNEAEQGPGFGRVVWIAVLLPFIYILSIGPVALLSKKTGGPRQTIRNLYFPVIWLHEHTPLKRPLEIYVSLWGAN